MSSGHTHTKNIQIFIHLLPFLRPYKWILIGMVALLPLLALLNALQPFLLKEAVDLYLSSNNYNKHLAYILPIALGVCSLGVCLIQIIQNLTIQKIGQKIVTRLRFKLFQHIQKLSIEFFEQNSTGRLLTRITSDLEPLSETLASGFIGALGDLLSIIGLMSFMLYINWQLSLVEFALIPVIVLLLKMFQGMYRQAVYKARVHLGSLNSLFQETIFGILSIKLSHAETPFSQHFKDINVKYKKSNDQYITIDSSFSAMVELLGNISIILILVCVLGLWNNITPGELIAFVGYSQMLFQPIQSLSEKFGSIQTSLTSLERTFEILHTDNPTSNTSSQSITNLLPIKSIQLNNLSFQYNSKSNYALKNINFKLQQGQSLGIVGRTGAGKSTLVKLLSRLYDPTSGEILINNKENLTSLNTEEIRKHILLIPQRSFLFSGSIADNLLLNNQNIPTEKLLSLCEETGLIELIHNLPHGLDTEIREGGISLSNGQKQLISLTRALIQQSEILILDEATADLDTYTEQLVTRATSKILNSGKTIIFIAHRMNLVKECDHVLVFGNGEIMEQGNHDTLMQTPTSHYRYLYNLSQNI